MPKQFTRFLRAAPVTTSHKKGGAFAGPAQQLLDADGSVQAEFNGERRIHSRPHTRQLVGGALASKTDKDHEQLGRRLLSIWAGHDKAQPDYARD